MPVLCKKCTIKVDGKDVCMHGGAAHHAAFGPPVEMPLTFSRKICGGCLDASGLRGQYWAVKDEKAYNKRKREEAAARLQASMVQHQERGTPLPVLMPVPKMQQTDAGSSAGASSDDASAGAPAANGAAAPQPTPQPSTQPPSQPSPQPPLPRDPRPPAEEDGNPAPALTLSYLATLRYPTIVTRLPANSLGKYGLGLDSLLKIKQPNEKFELSTTEVLERPIPIVLHDARRSRRAQAKPGRLCWT